MFALVILYEHHHINVELNEQTKTALVLHRISARTLLRFYVLATLYYTAFDDIKRNAEQWLFSVNTCVVFVLLVFNEIRIQIPDKHY